MLRTAVLVMVLLGCALLTAPPAAAAETATCSAPGQPGFRVTWQVELTGFGPLARVTALERQQGGAWVSAATSTWELRWETQPDQVGTSFPPFNVVTGDLAQLNQRPVSTLWSPRLVAPDGSCTVYLYPFHGTSGPRVAVVGDSLLQQLNDPDYNRTWLQGFAQGNLAAQGRSTEVEGQGGRRWTPVPGTTDLVRADGHLLDELRGLRTHGLAGMVVALGANDAGWVAQNGLTESERESRLNDVLTGIDAALAELAGYGVCVVVVTGPDHPGRYWGSDPAHYAWAERAVNDRLRFYAGIDGADWLQLEDWAAASDGHHFGDPDPWYVDDDIHLNDTGRLHYTAALVRAGTAC
jgi:hypothetical protein